MSETRIGSKHPPIKKAFEIMRRLADVSSPPVQIDDTLLMHFAIAAVDAVRQHDAEMAASTERLRACEMQAKAHQLFPQHFHPPGRPD